MTDQNTLDSPKSPDYLETTQDSPKKLLHFLQNYPLSSQNVALHWQQVGHGGGFRPLHRDHKERRSGQWKEFRQNWTKFEQWMWARLYN